MQKASRDNVIEIHDIKGYASLAALIASDQDKSVSIYRRFDRLSARNLLYLQSELAELEAEQDALDEQALCVDINELKSSRDWTTLKTQGSDERYPRDREKLRLVYEIRKSLKEYREALLLESTLLSVRRPQKRTLEAYQNEFMNIDACGQSDSGSQEGFPTLGGHSAGILNDPEDLMALKERQNEDRLSSFLRHCFPILFITRNTNGRLAYLSERRLGTFVALVYIIFAAVLLWGAIINLYLVTDEKKRLGLIAGYTTAFAMCLALLHKAEGHQVFAASAAYSAVLVVFVSGNLGSSGGAGNTP